MGLIERSPRALTSLTEPVSEFVTSIQSAEEPRWRGEAPHTVQVVNGIATGGSGDDFVTAFSPRDEGRRGSGNDTLISCETVT